MKVVVLTTSARIGRDWVDDLVGALPPCDELELSLVALTRPAARLPVARCLVVGRSLRPGRAVRDMPVVGAGGQAQRSRGRVPKRLDRALLRAAPRRWSADNAMLLATGAVWSRVVRDEVARADFVVAHDYNATWAAWLLARRVAGPHFVFQTEGMHLKLAELGASGAADG
jgi:hypothetical protein